MEMLPEKYYESCITYNIVNYYDEEKRIKIYPYSISQNEENDLGYDFGYEVVKNMFFIQYKRPHKKLSNGKFTWLIDLEQLETIMSNEHYCNSVYYCLPNFNDIKQWYNAFDNSYFIKATILHKQLEGKLRKGQKIKSIRESRFGMKTWYEIENDEYLRIDRKNLAYKIEDDNYSNYDYKELNKWLNKVALSQDEKLSGMYGYYLLEKK